DAPSPVPYAVTLGRRPRNKQTAASTMNNQIFREYDIRGIVGKDLTGDVPELIGRAFGSELRARLGGRDDLTVAIGRDNRPSSPELAEGIIRGVTSAGVHVI